MVATKIKCVRLSSFRNKPDKPPYDVKRQRNTGGDSNNYQRSGICELRGYVGKQTITDSRTYCKHLTLVIKYGSDLYIMTLLLPKINKGKKEAKKYK